MKTYKGFKIYKINNIYFVSNEKDGQIAPHDDLHPTTIKECKKVINDWLEIEKHEL